MRDLNEAQYGLLFYKIVGQKFAMCEMKCVISKIIRNFEISLSNDNELDRQMQLTAELVLRPANPIKFKLKRRVWNDALNSITILFLFNWHPINHKIMK